MENLIEELKNDHAFIMNTLKEAKDLMITSEEGRETLSKAKDALLTHLKKEDDYLYPVLKRAAESDPELQKIIDELSVEMEDVSQKAINFFDKYVEGEESIDFAKDFARLYITLTRRVKKEGETIYKKYDELIQSNSVV